MPRISAGIRHIFAELARIMKRGSNIVVQADNLPGRTFTPLVRDLGTAIGEVFRAEAEIVDRLGGRAEGLPPHALPGVQGVTVCVDARAVA